MLLTLLQLAAFWTAKSSDKHDDTSSDADYAPPSKTDLIAWVGGTSGCLVKGFTLQMDRHENDLDEYYKLFIETHHDLMRHPLFNHEYSMMIPFEFAAQDPDTRDLVYKYSKKGNNEIYLHITKDYVKVEFMKVKDDDVVSITWGTMGDNSEVISHHNNTMRTLIMEEMGADYILTQKQSSLVTATKELAKQRQVMAAHYKEMAKLVDDPIKNHEKITETLRGLLEEKEDAGAISLYNVYVSLPHANTSWEDDEGKLRALPDIISHIRQVTDQTCFEDGVNRILCSKTNDHERLAEMDKLFDTGLLTMNGVTHIAYDDMLEPEKAIAKMLSKKFKRYRNIFLSMRLKNRVERDSESWKATKMHEVMKKIIDHTEDTCFESEIERLAKKASESIEAFDSELRGVFNPDKYGPGFMKAQKRIGEHIIHKWRQCRSNIMP